MKIKKKFIFFVEKDRIKYPKEYPNLYLNKIIFIFFKKFLFKNGELDFEGFHDGAEKIFEMMAIKCYLESTFYLYDESGDDKYNIQKYMTDLNIPLKLRHLCLEGVAVNSRGKANLHGLLK